MPLICFTYVDGQRHRFTLPQQAHRESLLVELCWQYYSTGVYNAGFLDSPVYPLESDRTQTPPLQPGSSAKEASIPLAQHISSWPGRSTKKLLTTNPLCSWMLEAINLTVLREPHRGFCCICCSKYTKGKQIQSREHIEVLQSFLLATHYHLCHTAKELATRRQIYQRGRTLSIQLTSTQVLAMAPDASSASAAKKTANLKHWSQMGSNAEALWGVCQGSASYQVKVDLASLKATCSCPSRKLPCKHSLALLLLATTEPAALPESEPPTWVASWLQKRQVASKPVKAVQPSSTRSQAAQTKRTEKRQALVIKGLDSLDLWLHDLVRNGLASVQTQPASFWESRAAQMIDAQAPGIATHLRNLASIPNASRNWPEKLLFQLGLLTMLTHAYRHIDQIAPALQDDVRQMIGWNLSQEEVAERGQTIADEWLILGQTVVDEDRLRVQRTWLFGKESKRSALLLQFSAAGTPFPEIYPLGTAQKAELLFWPGAYPQRARFASRRGEAVPITTSLPGEESIDNVLANVASALARQPWLERFLCVLHNVTPILHNDSWYVRDSIGKALPLAKGDYWQMFALSGGYPVDLAGEWNGENVLPLGMLSNQSYYLLGRVLQ